MLLDLMLVIIMEIHIAFEIHWHVLVNETLLRMLSLDFLDKVAKPLDVHSTTVLLLEFFGKDQTSLDST